MIPISIPNDPYKMLLAHINPQDELGKKILDQLKEMSAAHKKEYTEAESYLTEDDHPIKGEAAILRFLTVYHNSLEAQREISADACYLDPETGEPC